MPVCLCHLCNWHMAGHCKGQILTTSPHQNAEGDLKHKGSGATKSNRGKEPTSCALCIEGSQKIGFSFQMANKLQMPRGPLPADTCASQGALHTGTLLSQGTVAWNPHQIHSQYTIDRQPEYTYTYLPLKQNTIPQQVKAITPTYEPDCIPFTSSEA